MARRSHTYAVRLAVEGGGQVKAELVSVGQSGERSLKRIETAGGRASGGLKGLGRQAELLRTGIRTLGGALAGVATVGGLAALVNRSISAADVIGKTADRIGVGVEALQELRFAAKAAGVEQGTLDIALQRFTRRAAEAAQGTGEAKDALAQMGIALRDQSGNLRRSEDLLADVEHRRRFPANPQEISRFSSCGGQAPGPDRGYVLTEISRQRGRRSMLRSILHGAAGLAAVSLSLPVAAHQTADVHERAVVVAGELGTIAEHLQSKPQMALDFTEVVSRRWWKLAARVREHGGRRQAARSRSVGERARVCQPSTRRMVI